MPEEISSIGVRLTLDASGFTAPLKQASGALNTFQQQAERAASGAAQGRAGRAVKGSAASSAAQNLTGVNVSLEVNATSLAKLRGEITKGLGAIPVTITPQFATQGRYSIQSIMGAMLSTQYGMTQQQGRQAAARAIEASMGSMPKKAAGGPVQANRPVIVGEHRPEVFVPKTPGIIEPSIRDFYRKQEQTRRLEMEMATVEASQQRRHEDRIHRMRGGTTRRMAGGPVEPMGPLQRRLAGLPPLERKPFEPQEIEREPFVPEWLRRAQERKLPPKQYRGNGGMVRHASAGVVARRNPRVFNTSIVNPSNPDYARPYELPPSSWKDEKALTDWLTNNVGYYSPTNRRAANYGINAEYEFQDLAKKLAYDDPFRDLGAASTATRSGLVFPRSPRGYDPNPLHHLVRYLSGAYGVAGTVNPMRTRIAQMEAEIEGALKRPELMYGGPGEWASPIGFFHATTNMPSVLEKGLMTGKELRATGMTAGLGGRDDYVSTTWSLKRARQIAASLRMMSTVARGEANIGQLTNYFEHRLKLLAESSGQDLSFRKYIDMSGYSAFKGGDDLRGMLEYASTMPVEQTPYGEKNPLFDLAKHADSYLAFGYGNSEVGEGSYFSGTRPEEMRAVDPKHVGVVQLAMRRPPAWQRNALKRGRPPTFSYDWNDKLYGQGRSGEPYPYADWEAEYHRATSDTDYLEHGVLPAEYEIRLPADLLTIIGRRSRGGMVHAQRGKIVGVPDWVRNAVREHRSAGRKMDVYGQPDWETGRSAWGKHLPRWMDEITSGRPLRGEIDESNFWGDRPGLPLAMAPRGGDGVAKWRSPEDIHWELYNKKHTERLTRELALGRFEPKGPKTHAQHGLILPKGYQDWANAWDLGMGKAGKARITEAELEAIQSGMRNYPAFLEMSQFDPARGLSHRMWYENEAKVIMAETAKVNQALKAAGISQHLKPRDFSAIVASLSSSRRWENANIPAATQAVLNHFSGAGRTGFTSAQHMSEVADILAGGGVTGVKRTAFDESFWGDARPPVDRWVNRVMTLQTPADLLSRPAEEMRSLLGEAASTRNWMYGGKRTPDVAGDPLRRAADWVHEQVASQTGMQRRHVQAEAWGWIRDFKNKGYWKRDKASGLLVPRRAQGGFAEQLMGDWTPWMGYQLAQEAMAKRAEHKARGSRNVQGGFMGGMPDWYRDLYGGSFKGQDLVGRGRLARDFVTPDTMEDFIARNGLAESAYLRQWILMTGGDTAIGASRVAIPWMQDQRTVEGVAKLIGLGRHIKGRPIPHAKGGWVLRELPRTIKGILSALGRHEEIGWGPQAQARSRDRHEQARMLGVPESLLQNPPSQWSFDGLSLGASQDQITSGLEGAHPNAGIVLRDMWESRFRSVADPKWQQTPGPGGIMYPTLPPSWRAIDEALERLPKEMGPLGRGNPTRALNYGDQVRTMGDFSLNRYNEGPVAPGVDIWGGVGYFKAPDLRGLNNPLEWTEKGIASITRDLDIRHNALGGPADRGLYIVNEVGKELFVPQRLAHIIPPKVMAQIPKAEKGAFVIDQPANSLFSPPENGIIVPHHLMNQVPHAENGVRGTGDQGYTFEPSGDIRGPFGTFVNRRDLAGGRDADPEWMNRVYSVGSTGGPTGYSGLDVPTFLRNQAAAIASAAAAAAPAAAAAAATSAGPEPAARSAEPPRGHGRGRSRVVGGTRVPAGGAERPRIFGADILGDPNTNPAYREQIEREMAGRDTAGSRPRRTASASVTYNRQGVPNIDFVKGMVPGPRWQKAPFSAYSSGGAAGMSEDRAAEFAQARQQLSFAAQSQAARTPRGMAAVLGAQFFGGRDTSLEAIAAQRRALSGLEQIEKGLNPDELGAYREKLDDLVLARKEDRQGIEDDIKTREGANPKLKAWNEANQEYQKTLKQGLPGLGATARNFAGIMAGVQVYSMAMQGLGFVMAAASPAISAMVDQLSGWQATSSKMTTTMAEGIKQSHGNIQAVVAQTAVNAGLTKSSMDYVDAATTQIAVAKAGAKALAETGDLFRAAMGAGNATQGLYGGYGGILNSGLFAQQMGGGTGYTEAIAGMFNSGGPDFASSINTAIHYLSSGTFRNFVNSAAKEQGHPLGTIGEIPGGLWDALNTVVPTSKNFGSTFLFGMKNTQGIPYGGEANTDQGIIPGIIGGLGDALSAVVPGSPNFGSTFIGGMKNMEGVPYGERPPGAPAVETAPPLFANASEAEKQGYEEYRKDLNAAIDRGAEADHKAAAAHWAFTASTEDIAKATRVAIAAGDDYGAELAQQGVVLKDLSGNVIESTEAYKSAQMQGARGKTILTPEIWAGQVTRQLQGQRQARSISTERAITIDFPWEVAKQLLTSPLGTPGAGFFPGANGGARPTLATYAGGAGLSGRAQGVAQGALSAAADANVALQQIAAEGMKQARAEITKNGDLGDLEVFNAAASEAGKLSKSIANATATMAKFNQIASQANWDNQIRLATRAWKDAIAMQGKAGGSRLGYLQREQWLIGRQQQQLSMALQQRSITTNLAVAQFQAPGETGEERYFRQKEAIAKAAIEQEQLNLTRKEFRVAGHLWTETASRAAKDASHVLDVMQKARDAEGITIAMQAKIAAQSGKLAEQVNKMDRIMGKATGNFDDELSAAASGISDFAGSVEDAMDAIYKALGYEKKRGQWVPGPDSPTHAAGFLGTTTGASSMTVGEAGTEHVAVLRNPRMASLGAMGGGGGPVNLSVNISGVSVRNDDDVTQMARKVATEVERMLSRKGQMFGLRGPAV
jgi:hypothetical protein